MLALTEIAPSKGFFTASTFDMSGGPKGAKRPLERPLDGRVRRRCLHGSQLDSLLRGLTENRFNGVPSKGGLHSVSTCMTGCND